jgi:hypothetical protein
MANIETTVDDENDLTVFTVKGELTAKEIIHHASEYYAKKPTRFVLWDVTSGTVGTISNDDFRQIAEQMKNYTSKRKGGKTAFVAKSIVDFGLGRMYGAFAEVEGLPVAYRTFRTIEEAKKWIFSNE